MEEKVFFRAILSQVFYVHTIAIRKPKHRDPMLVPRKITEDDVHPAQLDCKLCPCSSVVVSGSQQRSCQGSLYNRQTPGTRTFPKEREVMYTEVVKINPLLLEGLSILTKT